jgi:carbonic anhydrase
MTKTKWFLLVMVFLAAVAPQLWASGAGPGIQPDEALAKLKDGNARYVSGAPQHPNQGLQQRSATATGGQHPFATVLGCSDSRVPAEILFDSGIGDIFVVRVAGNVADTDEIGSVEYAVDHLGTPVLVVLGHTQCGAVTAVAQNAKLHGHVVPLVAKIRPAVAKTKRLSPQATGDYFVNEAIRNNVWQAIEDIYRRSPVVANRIRSGQLKVVGAIYHIDSGSVHWLGPHPLQDQFLTRTQPAKPGKKSDKPAGKPAPSKQ